MTIREKAIEIQKKAEYIAELSVWNGGNISRNDIESIKLHLELVNDKLEILIDIMKGK